ncbi:hypothetical protein Tco_1002171 [Tanacetum coccineum]|uniref:Uncharacterized protein n=1 Tax=Tanacetum coccineum TaxID=301880 RepID=A0ABQ5F6Z2_9ASTR
MANSLCWGLNVDIGNIPFSDLVAKLINGRRKGKRMSAILDICLLSLNICWAKNTRMTSSRRFIPNHISATSFKSSSANEDHCAACWSAQSINRSEKKKIPSSPEPKTSKNARESQSKKQVTETQHAKESIAIANATKSLEASESAKELRNQPKPSDAKKEQVTIDEEAIEDPLAIDSGINSMENVNLDELL